MYASIGKLVINVNMSKNPKWKTTTPKLVVDDENPRYMENLLLAPSLNIFDETLTLTFLVADEKNRYMAKLLLTPT